MSLPTHHICGIDRLRLSIMILKQPIIETIEQDNGKMNEGEPLHEQPGNQPDQ
jgi:hypothetical protein